MSKYELDMTQGSVFKNIIRFAVPLILTSFLSLFYNAADLIVVSRWAGNAAMASVGATTSIYNMIFNIFMGFSIGAGVAVSKRYGARDTQSLSRAVHTAMLLSIIVGILAAFVGMGISRFVLGLLQTPADVIDGATLYLRIICAALPATLVYNFGAAILRAVGDTKRPLYILACTGMVNVVLNLVLVIGFHWDVAGVAVATAVSNVLSALAVVYSLVHSQNAYRLVLRELHLYREELLEILKIGLPAGVQSSAFSLSNSVIQSVVNSFGTDAISGNAAAGNIEGFVYAAMNAWYQAVMTAVAQNYGAKNHHRIKQSIGAALVCVSTVGLVLGLCCALFARPLLSIYITDSQEAIEYGAIRMLVTCAPYLLCGIMEVLAGSARGFGVSTVTAVNSLLGVCGVRIFWIIAILPFHRTAGFLYLCWPISWTVVIILNGITLYFTQKRAVARMNLEE